MNLLERVQTGVSIKPRRTLLYGMHGIGKSSWAAKSPAHIILATEDGLGDIPHANRSPLITSYNEFCDWLRELMQSPHAYCTLVVDTLDWLEKLVWQPVEEKYDKPIGDIKYGKGYGYAIELWEKLLKGFDILRRERGMAVILLAHSQVKPFADPENDTYDQFEPRLHKRASALIQEWCDEVFFAKWDIATKQKDEGFGRKRAQAISGGSGRIIYTESRPAALAKNRLGLPPEMPLDYAFYAQHLLPELQNPTPRQPPARASAEDTSEDVADVPDSEVVADVDQTMNPEPTEKQEA